MSLARAAASPTPVAPSAPRFGAQLVQARLINADQLQVALHEQQQQGGLLGHILCRLGYLADEELAAALAARSGWPLLERDALTPDLKLLRALPHALAAQWQMLPLRLQEGALCVACSDPFDVVAQDQLRAHFNGAHVHYGLAPPQALRQAIARSYGAEPAAGLQDAPSPEAIGAWFADLLREALGCEASDLHFAPGADALQIRMRVDGYLHTVKTMHRAFWPALLQRIKILAAVNIAETRRPQDGRFSQDCDGLTIDCRAAFMPTIHGEAVTLRLLDPRRAQRSFAAMGFAPAQIARLEYWLARPEGLILVTGPTGSGKSTTLNAMLQALDSGARNIVTLEDPVEYHFEGIRQTQIREQHGLGFAEGVRTLLRHDPDVILIGEIRDAETAQQAMRAAMTGHLVLSSLHTADAPGAIPRLRDLGIAQDLLAQHLRGVIAQRLVRTLCPHCAPQRQAVTRAAGAAEACPHCFGTGRRGRTVVAELLGLPDDAAALFAPTGQPRDYARMWTHGRQLIASGRIAPADLAAVVPLPDA